MRDGQRVSLTLLRGPASQRELHLLKRLFFFAGPGDVACQRMQPVRTVEDQQLDASASSLQQPHEYVRSASPSLRTQAVASGV